MQLEHRGGFKYFREIRGDGNCYYRSVAVAYLELIVLSDNSLQAIDDIVGWLESQQGYYNMQDADFSSDPILRHTAVVQTICGHLNLLRNAIT